MKMAFTSIKGSNIKNILIIRPDAIGDLALTLPAMHALKKKFPEAKITALIREYTRPLLACSSDVDEIIYDYDLKKYSFDLSVNFYNRLPDTYATFNAGIPGRLGDSSRILTAWMNNLRVFRKWDDFTKHEVEFNLALLKPLGINIKDICSSPSISICPEALPKVDQLLDQAGIKADDLLVGIHIGAATSKTWTSLGFSELVTWLAQNTKAKVVLLGGKPEIERGEKIALLTKDPHLNLVGKIELGELIALISKLSMFIGMDTGATHIAASFGIPLVMLCLTKRAKPLRWGPWQTRHLVVVPDQVCPRPCSPASCPANLCVEQTSTEQVIAAVDVVLKGGGVSNRSDALYHWAQKSLGVAIIYAESNKDRAQKIADLLQAGGYRYYLTKETNVKKLLDLFISLDTLIIHQIGRAAGLAPFFAQQLTGSHMASRALLIKDNEENFKDCRELIDFYFARSRKG